MTLYLHGLGHFHPDNEITNPFLESLDIGTSEAWILERVGIHSRRTALPLDYIRTTRNENPAAAIEAAELSTSQMGARAAELAIARAGIDRSDIGLVVGGTCAGDNALPAEACSVAQLLGLEAPGFDVNSACTSFFAGLYVLANMRPEALPDYVLVVCPEALTRTVDYSDRSSAVLFGDGSVAAVVSASVPARARISANTLNSDPASASKVLVPRLGYFRQDGRDVQMFGIRRGTDMVRSLRQTHGSEDRPLHFVGHQANLRMLEAIARRCGVAPEHHHHNVERFGNTGAASGASVISERWDRWEDGTQIAMIGVGAGLTWSSFLLRFAGSESGARQGSAQGSSQVTGLGAA